MRSVGVRELSRHTSEILWLLREGGQEIHITYRGKVVALLVPVVPPIPAAEKLEAAWADLDILAAEIGARWREATSASASSERDGHYGQVAAEYHGFLDPRQSPLPARFGA